jgi:Flp pilus assembly protein TadB
MLLTIGLVLAAIGLIYLILSSLLPILQSSRTDPYTAYTGGAQAQAATAVQAGEYVSPTEAVLGVVWRGMADSKLKRRVAVGPAFHWGTLLDRMVAGALIAGGLGLIVFQQPLIAAIGFVAAPIILYYLAIRRAKTYEQKFLIQLPNALLLISSAMAAGRNFVNALEATTPNLADPIRSEMITLGNRISALRVTEAQAFEMWAERLPYPELHTISSALAIGNQVGLETYLLLRSLSSSIQDEIRGRNELEALTSQVKSTATVVSYLPLIFVLLIYLITPKFVTPLFTTGVGIVVIIIAVGMNYLSRWWTKRILKRIEA